MLPTMSNQSKIIDKSNNDLNEEIFLKYNYEQGNKIRDLNLKHNRTYQCEFCGIVLPTFQALGGHCSNTHKGKNYMYRIKLHKRHQRKYEREAWKRAKDFY